ncbi:hypothetical protein [Natrarchaeobaculum aegyptiacum]|uniref:Uncharacterized protein n=1 Tax=Natrarchaeobaculum aegyptiacum TaxID=745377 RepID=A0A2Z2HW49_9EURY|nr:hypothetical protein [Natrarchaeobaculum aegyptiacum]ARS91546.1 hypothetical protein B1756_18675 [Natrarchaeobaculum aegyptiacum]
MTDGCRRRGFLAGITAVSSVAVAGCNGLPWEDESTSTAFPAEEAATILTADAPAPDPPAPIDPSPEALESALERTVDLLAAVPDPLEAEHVPNGEIREEIDRAREDATDALTDYTDDGTVAAIDPTDLSADDRYHAFRATVDARESAREAAVAYAAIDDESIADELRTEHGDVADFEGGLTALEYLGEDTDVGRLRGALVATTAESDLERAARRVEHVSIADATTVLDLGEAAGGLEHAAATDDVHTHLDERYEDSLESPTDLSDVFERVVTDALDYADELDLPDSYDDSWVDDLVDADLEDDHLLERLVYDSFWPLYQARDDLAEAADEDRPGDGLDAALRLETHRRAFERVRERIDDGELGHPLSAEDIRAERESAIEAAEDALESITGPSPGSELLASTLEELEWLDDRIDRRIERSPDTNHSLGSEYRDYVSLDARLSVLSDAVRSYRGSLLA